MPTRDREVRHVLVLGNNARLEDWHPVLDCAVSAGLKQQFDDGRTWTEIERGVMRGLPNPDSEVCGEIDCAVWWLSAC